MKEEHLSKRDQTLITLGSWTVESPFLVNTLQTGTDKHF